jgi:predicted RNA-binding Zn-ribbon protein involved in translation (DUF1610 family)
MSKKSSTTVSLSKGVILTKYSRTNVPASRMVSLKGRHITWNHVPGENNKWTMKSTNYEVTAIHPFLPGSMSSHWFDNSTPPPPLSFAIVTSNKARVLRFTAPSLEAFVTCVNEVEEALGEKKLETVVYSSSGPSGGGGGSLRRSMSSPVSSELFNVLKGGSETETFCYSLPSIKPADFPCLYDRALRVIGSPVNNQNWVLASSGGGGEKDREVLDHMGVITRTGVSKHKTSSRFFTQQVTVNKSMIGFFDRNSDGEMRKVGSSSADVSRLVLIEMNTFSGAAYIDLFLVFVKWNVYSNDLGDGVIVEVNNMICFVKDTILKYPVTSEFKKYAQFTCDSWIKLMTSHIDASAKQRADGDDSSYSAMKQHLEKRSSGNQGNKDISSDNKSNSRSGSSGSGDVSDALKETILPTLISPQSQIGETSRCFFTNPSEPLIISPPSLAEPLHNHNHKGGNSTSNSHTSSLNEGGRIEGFICPQCGVIARGQGELMAHFTVFHTDTPIMSQEMNLSSIMSQEAAASGFVCPECMKQFKGGRALTKHFDNEHGGTTKPKPQQASASSINKTHRKDQQGEEQQNEESSSIASIESDGGILGMFDFSMFSSSTAS